MKGILLVFGFTLYTLSLLGQSDSLKRENLREYAWNLDNSLTKFDSSVFKIGSARVELKNYGNKLTAKMIIEGSSLTISLYLKDCELVMAKTIEPSPKMPDLSAFSEFYFQNDTVFHFRFYFTVPSCMALPLFTKNRAAIFGYNSVFTEEFLLSLIRNIVSRVKFVVNTEVVHAVQGR